MLTEKEIAALRLIADNVVLFDAVKKILTLQFRNDEGISLLNTDEELGQVVRARLEGLRKVEKGFKQIEQFKSPEEKGEIKNPAR
jgi:hypothetical protein